MSCHISQNKKKKKMKKYSSEVLDLNHTALLSLLWRINISSSALHKVEVKFQVNLLRNKLVPKD